MHRYCIITFNVVAVLVLVIIMAVAVSLIVAEKDMKYYEEYEIYVQVTNTPGIDWSLLKTVLVNPGELNDKNRKEKIYLRIKEYIKGFSAGNKKIMIVNNGLYMMDEDNIKILEINDAK